MKEKKKVLCTNLKINAIYQFLFLALVITLIYSKTIFFEYNLDDYIITDTLAGKVNSFRDLFEILKLPYNNADYRPIVFLSFGIESLFFGELNPAISHAINCVLYFLVCISGLQLFKLLFADSKNNFLVFLGVLLFCVHPINTEVVSSIKCRDNLLSMLFGILSSVYYLKFLKNNKPFYTLFIAFIFSLFAVFSKLDGFGFTIFNLFLVLFYNTNRKLINIIIVICFTVLVINIRFFVSDYFTNNNLSGLITFTENPLSLVFTTSNRIIAGINTIYFYFTKFIYTSSSKYYYGYNYYNILSTNTVSFFGGIIIITGFIFAFIYSILKKEKIITISIIGIISTSIYALNFIQPVAGIIADRYIFIANLFFCLLAVYSITKLFQCLKIQKHSYTIITVVVIVFSILSFKRVNAWRNFRTLIDTDAPKLYNSYEAMRIAAGAYYKEYEAEKDDAIRKDYLEKSIFYAEKGVKVYPKNYLLFLFLGQYYFKNNQTENAIQAFTKSIKNDTSTIDAFVYLGDVYYSIKKSDSALYYYKNGLNIEPTSQILINNISSVYYEMNDKDGCLKFNHDLLTKDSTIFAAHENLGYFYLNNNDTIKAIDYFKKSIKYGLDVNSLPIKIQ